MRIGLIAQLHGRPGGDLHPTWESVRGLARTAESTGFDMFVFEDALLYRWDEDTVDGGWESMAIAAAIAEATDEIAFGQSVVNAPYRSPAMTASMATTLDEISNGRYVLGIGAGNTSDSDYEAFGFPTDMRYSRFAESIAIIHALLREGKVDFQGDYWTAKDAELVLRGPHPEGPPINIAAGGPKMLQLVARYGDAWNWWGWDETFDQITDRMAPLVDILESACDGIGRDPSSVERTFDLYSIVPPGLSTGSSELANSISGSAEEIASFILGLGSLGIEEVRCDLTDKTPEAVEAMAPVVELVHAG
jgi:alkanesulfonate monooxygenase SsuD/methylene tetrahydromethanopterin reductase-like flavin-dependent oxidoreductase (luciferase family)